jgi:hypothetical protein
MKTDDENFDDFLKSKMTEESFTFEEQYWQKASAMLDEARPKKNRFFLWIAIGFVLSFTLAAIAFKATINNTLPKQLTQQTPVSSPTPTTLSNTTVQKELTSPGKPIPTALVSNKPMAFAQPPVQGKQPTNPATFVLPKSTYTIKPSQNSRTKAVKSTKKSPASPNTNSPFTPAEKPTSSNEVLLATNKEAEPIPSDLPVEEINSISLESHWVSSLFNHQPLLTPAERLLLQTPQANNQSKPAYVRNNLFVEAGVNWFNTNQLNAEDLGAHVGLSYAFPVRKKLGMSIGLGYTQLHQSTGTRYYATVSYGFSEQRKTTGIKTVQLDYVELPVLVNYAITPKQGVFAGASLLYILRSSDYKKNDGDLTFDTKTANYFKAYQPIDAQMILGYHCWLSTKVRLSASYHYGLVDITQNAAFKRDENNTNKGIRFTIGYQLF